MRTKTLLLTAALGAAGIATSMAQVYSQNAVGYINLTLPVGFSMIVNQLIVPDYSYNALLPPSGNTPPGTQIFKPKTSGGFDISTLDDFGGGWLPFGTNTLAPGSGAWIKTPTAFTLTFVGEVPQGPNLSTPTLTPGFSMVGSQVPQAGLVSTDLKLDQFPGNQIFKYQGAGQPFAIFTVDDFPPNAWLPSQPSFAVGEAFWLLRPAGAPAAWTRSFTVN